MNLRYVVSIIPIFVIILVEPNCAQTKRTNSPMIDQQTMDLMQELDKADEFSRMQLLSKVDSQRNELLGVLLKHLGTSNSKNVQAGAIYLIGRHRLSQGVQELIHWIDFAPPKEDNIHSLPLWETYPAYEALVNIGKPSIPKVIELLATDSVDIRRDLAVRVIKYVEDNDIAKFILQREFDRETNSTRKENFRDAISRLNRIIEDTK